MPVELYPFQQKALDDTADRNRVAYYLDMGLGKTFVGAEKAKQLDAKYTLVVCQKAKIQDWIEHFEKVLNFKAYDLTDKEHFREWFLTWGFGVINYDLIFRRADFLNLKDFTLILDESSLIQNEKAKRTKFILKLKPQNVILLSGTPTAGKYENLWSQLNLSGWSITQKVYNQQYVNWTTIDVEGFPLKIVDKETPYKNVERLKAKMRKHGAVFMKSDEVFDLPDQNIIEIKIGVTREYKRFQKNHYIKIGDEELIGDTTLSKRIYSRMLCGHYNAEKLNHFRALCESTNDRLVVFYNFNAELHELKRIAAELEKPISEVNGNLKDLTAHEQDENSITFVQFKAGAMGLNLQLANKVIYFTLTDEAELFEQSKKRIHRIGQKRPCFYYFLICKNSIEETEILPMLGLRKQYSDELFIERGVNE